MEHSIYYIMDTFTYEQKRLDTEYRRINIVGQANELISIIVPVFNNEKYLDRCLNSIVSQSYQNLEIILINDGSIDASGKICDKWGKKDNRIKVIHTENKGASAARNIGLKYATGKYLGFVDSDDWIEAEMYQRLYSLVKKYDADMSICNVVSKKNRAIYVEIWNKTEHLNRFFRVEGKAPIVGIWRKLIKRELFEGYSFIEGRMNEDIHTSYWLAQKSNKTVYTSEEFYNYFKNVEGVTNSKFTEKKLDLIYIWDVVKQITNELTPEYEEACRMNCKRARFTLLSQMYLHGYDNANSNLKKIKKQLKEEVRKAFFELLRCKMPLSRKILLLIICI